MKRNIIIFIISCIFIYFIFTNNTLISTSILNSINLFINKVFISILPMYFITKILINYNIPYYISKIFHSTYIYLFIASILSSTPSNASIIKDLLDNKQIDKVSANTYIMCNTFINPVLIHNILKDIISTKEIIIIISVSYLSNIIIYLLHRKSNGTIKKRKEISISNLLTIEVTNFSKIILNILVFIIIFNLLSLMVPTYFKGLLEVTNGLSLIKTFNNNIRSILSLIYINFGGLCIAMQIKSIIGNDISYSNYLLGRFYACIISISLYMIINLF